ncbi:MAG: CPBP family intramembrane metalloprotease [Methylotenera sp.]|nr:CPBP family intramembrane metalloprotease [Oligoflexia bacterium]
MLGEPGSALGEAAVEGLTFGFGYGLSERTPFTLDGVPEAYPTAQTGVGGARRSCQKYNPATRRCLRYVQTSGVRGSGFNLTPVDLTRPIGAAFLQEIGLKYHMMNVFEAYREALKRRGGDLGQGLEEHSSKELLLEPFRSENISSAWVYVPLGLLTGFVVWDYTSQMRHGLTPTQPLNTRSNGLIAFNQTILYPFGSGAPEEMFYRGFIQNEAYFATGSPALSVAASTAAFTFSHSPEGYLTAAISGTYLGALAYLDHGKLGKGITLHFWSVVVLGVETFLLVKKSQAYVSTSPLGISAALTF